MTALKLVIEGHLRFRLTRIEGIVGCLSRPAPSFSIRQKERSHAASGDLGILLLTGHQRQTENLPPGPIRRAMSKS